MKETNLCVKVGKKTKWRCSWSIPGYDIKHYQKRQTKLDWAASISMKGKLAEVSIYVGMNSNNGEVNGIEKKIDLQSNRVFYNAN